MEYQSYNIYKDNKTCVTYATRK